MRNWAQEEDCRKLLALVFSFEIWFGGRLVSFLEETKPSQNMLIPSFLKEAVNETTKVFR